VSLRNITTLALVLRKTNFSDFDIIFSLLSNDLGKISAIAKGVRRIKSKKAGHLDLGAVSKVYLSKGKNMFLITQAETNYSTNTVKEDFNLKFGVMETLEVLNAIPIEEYQAKQYLELYKNFLNNLNHGDLESALLDFYLGVFKLMGLWKEELESLALAGLRAKFEGVLETPLKSGKIK